MSRGFFLSCLARARREIIAYEQQELGDKKKLGQTRAEPCLMSLFDTSLAPTSFCSETQKLGVCNNLSTQQINAEARIGESGGERNSMIRGEEFIHAGVSYEAISSCADNYHKLLVAERDGRT